LAVSVDQTEPAWHYHICLGLELILRTFCILVNYHIRLGYSSLNVKQHVKEQEFRLQLLLNTFLYS